MTCPIGPPGPAGEPGPQGPPGIAVPSDQDTLTVSSKLPKAHWKYLSIPEWMQTIMDNF